ncbi:Carbamoyl-phosphate synthase small chain [Buchnera aphidicola (Thelaxes suberi)]|uniref:glutamine-hydrolyzing carbamoyl-phosphate synthase small subunit n=1 Tax=Buchnera aphidicola TaxID=9 RepID=UPI00346473D5
MNKKAVLVLENGMIFHGYSIGINGSIIGEIVFNTSMTGYQEILSDPSYSNQIITFTFPQIGNTGINKNDQESDRVHAKGIIIHTLTKISSNQRSTNSLQNYLIQNKIIGITGIDTRKITHILRRLGSQKGCIFTEHQEDYYSAYKKIKKFSGIEYLDLARIVSTKKSYFFVKNTQINNSFIKEKKFNVIVYDFGVKKSILKILSQKNCSVNIVPAEMPFEEIIKIYKKNKKRIDGIILSNGPGDPRPCTYAIKNIKKIIIKKIPILGICLGHQLLALANGANIKKMKYGHHGSNHPVKDLINNQVIITAQNHNFTIDSKNLPNNIKITHVSLFDKSIQGITLKNTPALGFQGHPESNPGPEDSSYIFNIFIEKMKILN